VGTAQLDDLGRDQHLSAELADPLGYRFPHLSVPELRIQEFFNQTGFDLLLADVSPHTVAHLPQAVGGDGPRYGEALDPLRELVFAQVMEHLPLHIF
jgi:hypothetical protein